METRSNKAHCSLDELSLGSHAEIHAVGKTNLNIQTKLLAMGILPGKRLSIISRFPSFVFQVGNSQFTVDRQIAEQIWLKPKTTEVEKP